MRQIYTNENRLLAMHSRNVLESAGVKVELKNEYAAGSAVPGHQIWLELWVSDADYDRSVALLKHAEQDSGESWLCSKCSEENDANFSMCWKCQSENLSHN